jgi:hypothetical protein
MQRLDERFGIGAQFGSCEDVDFFVRLQGRSVYSPEMIVFHPAQTVEMVPLAKARSYSFGFGALCRKHAFKFGSVYLALTMFKKMAQVLSGNVQLQTAMILIRDRLRGFMAFPNP